jgi:phosphonate transport system substrate-binding protein
VVSRRLFAVNLLLLLASCQSKNSVWNGKLTVGLVSYGEGIRSLEKLENFKNYLSEELKTIIELEPTFNEIKAIEQIKKQTWSLVFAPPGLAAIAISQAKYIPIFPLEGVSNLRSVIVVLDNSPIRQLKDLTGKVIALGQEGSATGYYLPIYNLYGTTLAEVKLADTPEKVLELVAKQQVVAGALSKAEFENYRAQFPETKFRILFIDPHNIPSGSILVSPKVEPQQLQQIRQVMKSASPYLVQSAGYVTNGKVPDYTYMIKVVERVVPIAQRIREKPAPLY